MNIRISRIFLFFYLRVKVNERYIFYVQEALEAPCVCVCVDEKYLDETINHILKIIRGDRSWKIRAIRVSKSLESHTHNRRADPDINFIFVIKSNNSRFDVYTIIYYFSNYVIHISKRNNKKFFFFEFCLLLLLKKDAASFFSPRN